MLDICVGRGLCLGTVEEYSLRCHIDILSICLIDVAFPVFSSLNNFVASSRQRQIGALAILSFQSPPIRYKMMIMYSIMLFGSNHSCWCKLVQRFWIYVLSLADVLA